MDPLRPSSEALSGTVLGLELPVEIGVAHLKAAAQWWVATRKEHYGLTAVPFNATHKGQEMDFVGDDSLPLDIDVQLGLA